MIKFPAALRRTWTKTYYTAPAQVPVVELATGILTACGVPHSIEPCDRVLDQPLTWYPGEPWSQIVDDLLFCIGYRVDCWHGAVFAQLRVLPPDNVKVHGGQDLPISD